MAPDISKKSLHDEVEQYAQTESSQEPHGSDFNISVSIPESIEVKMVDASVLSDYEIWFFSASAMLSFCCSFAVAYCQEADNKAAKVHGVAALIFGAIFVACFAMTLSKRHALKKKGKTIRLKTSKIAEEKR